MLRKLMQRLKPSNLITGFKATGICPLNSNEVLKRLPDETADNSFNESVFDDSVLKVLRENCGVRLECKRKQSKWGEKVRKTDLSTTKAISSKVCGCLVLIYLSFF